MKHQLRFGLGENLYNYPTESFKPSEGLLYFSNQSLFTINGFAILRLPLSITIM